MSYSQFLIKDIEIMKMNTITSISFYKNPVEIQLGNESTSITSPPPRQKHTHAHTRAHIGIIHIATSKELGRNDSISIWISFK